MAESENYTFTGLLLLLTNVLLAVSRFLLDLKSLFIFNLNFIHSGVFSASSPALSVTSAVLATIVIATTKYRLEVTDPKITGHCKVPTSCVRLPVLLLWPVSALAVVSATLAMSSLLPVPLTLLLSPMVSLVQGFLSLPM